MKRKIVMIVLTVMSVMLLVSCGNKMPKELKAEDISEDTLYIKADGSIQVAYSSDFKEKYYNVDELKSFIYSELKEYNDKFGEETAVLSDILEDKKQVKMVLIFKESKAFVDFSKNKSNLPVSFPSFSKIKSEFSSVDFISAEGDRKQGKDVFDSDKDNAVLISGPILLKTEKNIKFYSAGKLIDKNNVSLSEEDKGLVIFSR